MIHSLAYKADFAQTVTRFAAWWEGDLLDRPPVTVQVTPSRPYQGPPANHATERACWSFGSPLRCSIPPAPGAVMRTIRGRGRLSSRSG